MAREPQSSGKPTPHETRRQNTARRLQKALDRLVAGTPRHPSLQGRPYRLTVTALAREAGVGRNTVYTQHRAILDAVPSADPRAPALNRPTPEQQTVELRALIEQLQQQKRQLATENAALLKRAIDAEKEVARLERQNAKLHHDLGVVRRPIAFPQR
jgi:hypothetical protein